MVPMILRTINETRSDHEKTMTDISALDPEMLTDDPIIPLRLKGKPQQVVQSLTPS